MSKAQGMQRCRVQSCKRKFFAKGRCQKHYQEQRYYKPRPPLKSDNLRWPDLTGSQEHNLCALVRGLGR